MKKGIDKPRKRGIIGVQNKEAPKRYTGGVNRTERKSFIGRIGRFFRIGRKGICATKSVQGFIRIGFSAGRVEQVRQRNFRKGRKNSEEKAGGADAGCQVIAERAALRTQPGP